MGKCIHRCIAISTGSGKSEGVQELRDFFAESVESRYIQLEVEHDGFPTIIALLNDERGWLMLLRYDGDGGFSSRNLAYSGPSGEVVDYYLDNGQRDEYPASWTYSRAEIIQILIEFAETRQTPKWVHWHNDSGDGNKSPNEPFEVLD